MLTRDARHRGEESGPSLASFGAGRAATVAGEDARDAGSQPALGPRLGPWAVPSSATLTTRQHRSSAILEMASIVLKGRCCAR